jgi:hypothetical protein
MADHTRDEALRSEHARCSWSSPMEEQLVETPRDPETNEAEENAQVCLGED